MSKKLLSEAQVRRFQNLASITPLQEMGNYSMKRDEEKPMEEELVQEEEVEEGMYKRDEEPMEAMHKRDEEEKMEEKMEDDDVDVEMDDADGDEVEMTSDALDAINDSLKTLQRELAPLLDAADEDDSPADDMPMAADEPAGDMPMPGMDEPADEPDDDAMLQEALDGINYQPSQKEIIKEVAVRVARRLQEAKQAQAKLNKALGKK
jgi:hypothetical protein